MTERAAEKERRNKEKWRKRTGHTHDKGRLHDNCPACWSERVADEKREAEAEAERQARENARIRKGQVLAGCATDRPRPGPELAPAGDPRRISVRIGEVAVAPPT